ncbi:PREDICTED: U-box domain-containing protein 52-like [Nicotiana attenuata]|uniref:U-box domain-containing protein 52 n=1 Tax=Nicotiana attenuata TaxID=49451 RepID=A0A1J6IW93_NICAT|nr:PREDICTED: U-box domain-containing protein 52-like [Nicotiana attenuata]OIT04856.1 u-box domain-containing protein 52 [Nicotiana attenuata]
MSWEIEEIGEDSKSEVSNKDCGGITNDVYVAVGKNDLHVLQWALDHAISPGIRICLVHIFPPITYIPSPVGKLSKSQLSREQVQAYINQESNRRKNLLEKYIRLCNDAKVPVDTVLVESKSPAKTLLDLITVVNVTSIVIGTKRSLSTIRVKKGHGVGEYVQKNAPDFCQVKVVSEGKEIKKEHVVQLKRSSNPTSLVRSKQSDRNFFECMCFSGKFN